MTTFTGNLTINKSDWTSDSARPNVITDIIIYNKVSQTLEFLTYDPTYNTQFTNRQDLDKTNVFVIPTRIRNARQEYPQYGNVAGIAFTLSTSTSIVVNLDTWKTKQGHSINDLFNEAQIQGEEGDLIKEPKRREIIMDQFRSELKRFSDNAIILPPFKLNSQGEFDNDQIYQPFIDPADSKTAIITFLKWKTLDPDTSEAVQADRFKNDWIEFRNQIVTKPANFIKEDYLYVTESKRRLTRSRISIRGVNL